MKTRGVIGKRIVAIKQVTYIFALVEGPGTGEFSVVDLDTAIELGNDYTWAKRINPSGQPLARGLSGVVTPSQQ